MLLHLGKNAPSSRCECCYISVFVCLCVQQDSQCITPELVAALYSQDTERLVEAAHRCRKLLSREPNPPIDEVIRAGVVPRFVQLLQAEHQRLQVSAHCSMDFPSPSLPSD